MSSSKRSRRHFTTEQKVAILRRHMVDKVPVSDLCNEENLQPSVFYTWQRQALENLGGAFSTPAADGPSKREKELVAKTKELENATGAPADVFAQSVPLGRLESPDDAAEVVALLASDRGKWMTGANILIDGGMTAR